MRKLVPSIPCPVSAGTMSYIRDMLNFDRARRADVPNKDPEPAVPHIIMCRDTAGYRAPWRTEREGHGWGVLVIFGPNVLTASWHRWTSAKELLVNERDPRPW